MTGTADLLSDLSRRGIELAAHGDRLRYRPRSAVTPDLAERLRIHKCALLAILRAAGAPDAAVGAPMEGAPEAVASRPGAAPERVRWEDCIDPGEPCPKCRGLVFWWNPWGDRRCVGCDPLITTIKALESVERIRRRHRIPSPIGAAEVLAELKRFTDT